MDTIDKSVPICRTRFSDPFCMLGILPGTESPSSPLLSQESPPSPRQNPPLSPRGLAVRAYSDCGNYDSNSLKSPGHDKLKKHHSFRLSFKRRDTIAGRRGGEAAALPAKFIRATSVRPHTLNPRWNERFRFDIDDVSSDLLHLDIWDHDDESSVLEAVSHLNQVRGVKGLGRFFKQIAQSARSGSQDDFLGCTNIPLQDIPSTGYEGWYKLEGRSQRSNIQGRIHLKLWLSTREDRGTSEEDNWGSVYQQEQLYRVFIAHELERLKCRSWEWGGEIARVANTILHQHAIQGDISDLQLVAIRWVAYAAVDRQTPLDPKNLYRLLKDLEQTWAVESSDKELEEWLAESFTHYIDSSLRRVRNHRQTFPFHDHSALARLDKMLLCLNLLSNMKAFIKCCPFHKDIRAEIVLALRKSSTDWFNDIHKKMMKRTDVDASFHNIAIVFNVLTATIQTGLQNYQTIFERCNGISYFNAVYKNLDKLVGLELASHVAALCFSAANAESSNSLIPAFELYLAIQEFTSMREHLTGSEEKLMTEKYYEWFLPVVQAWLVVAEEKAQARVRAALELSRVVAGEQIVRHSTASVDIAACFLQIQELWGLLAWSDSNSLLSLTERVVQVVTTAAIFFSELVHQRLQDTGYYEDLGSPTCSDDMCVCVNDLECVRRSLGNFGAAIGLEVDSAITLLDRSNVALEARAAQITNRVAAKMRPAIRKAIFHLAWSPETLPATEAILPLLDLLDSQLSTVNTALLPKNFERILADVWDTVLLELGVQLDASTGEQPCMYFERLHQALELLVHFFHAEDKGLTSEAIHTKTCKLVEQQLVYHCTETERLMVEFYQQRLEEQCRMDQAQYGVLSVRAYFNHDSLFVEVVSARDVIPLDTNGFSDPFVIVQLIPQHVFPNCSPQQTNVHKKTLNPVFDECFEFSVSQEQCRDEGAMLVFTVMDHDVLTANDFAGEAFLSLNSVSGVADSSRNDSFHGLKTHHLNLMHQTNKNHPILKILESRKWDRIAQNFVKDQKLRFASPAS